MSTFYQKCRKRHRLFRVTQRDVHRLLHVSVRFAPGQKATHGVKELTRLLYSSPEVFTTIIPLRDGISVAVKRKQDLQDLQDLQD